MKLFALQDRVLAWRRRSRRRPGPARGVLLISSGGLGDTVLFSLVAEQFRGLAEADEPVTVLLNQGADKMAFLLPPDLGVETVDLQRLRRDLGYRRRTMEHLFQANYRLVVHTDFLRHPEMDEALAFACAAPETVAMAPRAWPKYNSVLDANRARYDRLFDSGPPIRDKVRRWHAFGEWLTGRAAPLPDFLLGNDRLPPTAEEAKPLVIIQPFSAVREKQSPAALYANIVAALPADTAVAIAGAPSDRRKNPDFEPLLALPNVSYEDATFENLAPRLRAARLVISVDTACMHLAAVLGAPTLCLASAAYVGEIVPYDLDIAPPNIRFIYTPMPCAGCLGNCSLPLENTMFPCVARLDETAVLGAAKEMLQSPSSSSDGHWPMPR